MAGIPDLPQLLRDYSPAVYVLHEDVFVENARALQAAMRGRYPRAVVAYSYKTNYTPAICRTADAIGLLAEVVSEMELWLATRLGVQGERIIFNGPVKTPISVQRALAGGVAINIDSLADLARVVRAAVDLGLESAPVGIRCNFPMDSGGTSRFGLDADSEEFHEAVRTIRTSGHTRLAGLHCHYPDRTLDSFSERAQKLVRAASDVFQDPPDYLDVGGGFFGELPEGLKASLGVDPPSFEDYAEAVTDPVISEFGRGAAAPRLIVEPGTALVANAMSSTRVSKVSKRFGASILQPWPGASSMSVHTPGRRCFQ